MIRIDVNVINEEVILRLETLPRRLREQLRRKMEALFGYAEAELLTTKQGKYLDKGYVRSEVVETGSLLIGALEVDDKPGFYSIYPTKASVLKFVPKDGEVVFTKRVTHHPYMKGAPIVERYFSEHKPWLIEQVEDFVFESVYDAR